LTERGKSKIVTPVTRLSVRCRGLRGLALLAVGMLFPACALLPHGRALYTFECCLDSGDPEFARALAALTGEPLLPGNRCDLLENGKEIFPAMLEAIRGARSTLNLEMYIFQSDATGIRFARAIEERARAGIRCRVLVDGWGSHNLTKSLEAEMRRAGVEFERFRPLLLFHKFKNRTHRKLLVVDGRIAFLGGEGLDRRWEGDATSPSEWHEAAVRVEGPAVAEFQRIFAENWIHRHRAVPSGPGDYPALTPAGDDGVMALKSSFGDRNSASALALGLLLRASKKRLWIENAYFIPNAATIDGMAEAARRGVDVEVIVPGKSIDTTVVRPVSRATYGRLLEAGVKIYEYGATMMHAKTLTMDGLWSTVGSINIDNRSFLLNDEANATIRSETFAAGLEEMFRRDREKSREVTLDAWKRRPISEKLGELFWGLFEQEF
jgi:cardiolipin synthase